MRSIVLATCLALVVAGCGGDEVTLTEYAEELEQLVTSMNREIDSLDAMLLAEPTTVDGTQAYFDAKLAARYEFIEGLRALEPPEDASETHETALDLVTRLTAAEEALAQRANELDDMDELEDLWSSAERRAADAIDEEAVAFCQKAQAQMDATTDREVFTDIPWIPSELQEVVLVFFGCSKEDRGGA